MTPIAPTRHLSEMAIPITVDDESYYLDLGRISIQQGMVIQGRTGKTIEDLFSRFTDLVGGDDASPDEDPAAKQKRDLDQSQEMLGILHCFWWLMRAQSGIREPIADADGPLFVFLTALLQGMLDGGLMSEDVVPAEVLPDPTPPSPPSGAPSREPSTPKAATRKRSQPRAAPQPTG